MMQNLKRVWFAALLPACFFSGVILLLDLNFIFYNGITKPYVIYYSISPLMSAIRPAYGNLLIAFTGTTGKALSTTIFPFWTFARYRKLSMNGETEAKSITITNSVIPLCLIVLIFAFNEWIATTLVVRCKAYPN